MRQAHETSLLQSNSNQKPHSLSFYFLEISFLPFVDVGIF